MLYDIVFGLIKIDAFKLIRTDAISKLCLLVVAACDDLGWNIFASIYVLFMDACLYSEDAPLCFELTV